MMEIRLLYFALVFVVAGFGFCGNLKTYVKAEQVEEFLVEPRCTDMKKSIIEHHLATKTPYRAVANLDVTPYKFEGCQPKRIWAIIRHGTRTPSKKVILKANTDLEMLKQRILNNPNNRLCTEEKIRLKYWRFNASADEEKFLVPEGEEEAIGLAERMQARLPDLLPDYYDPHLYSFKYTKTQRTEQSALSFAIGLFGKQNIKSVVFPEALHRDPILRFLFRICI